MFAIAPTPLKKLEHPIFVKRQLEVWMKLDYLNHEFVSGNKLRKLKHNLRYFQQKGYRQIISFGGPHSNHLYALAFLGSHLKVPTLAFVRGDYHLAKSPTIQYCEKKGMNIVYLSKALYQLKEDPDFLSEIQEKYPDAFILPEGGRNQLSKEGCGEIVTEVDAQLFDQPTHFISAVGTGTTICGIADKLSSGQIALGISTLKGENVDDNLLETLRPLQNNLKINTEYHFGGYASFDQKLVDFVDNFTKKYNIPIDPIYNSKSVFALFDLSEKSYFAKGSRIVIIHTGGLQGTNAYCKRYKLSPSIFGTDPIC